MTDEPVTERPAEAPPGEAIGPDPHRALNSLTGPLADRGLRAVLVSDALLLALNPAVPTGPTPSAFRGPGLQQLITCRAGAEGETLWFWWVWSVAENYAPVEFGPLCPATDVDAAADRIARVLAVHEASSFLDA